MSNFNYKVNLNQQQTNIKIEEMNKVIHMSTKKHAEPHWQKNVPVYGYIKENYPRCVKPSLLNRYKEAVANAESLKEISEEKFIMKDREKGRTYTGVTTQTQQNNNNSRKDPELINDYVMNESN